MRTPRQTVEAWVKAYTAQDPAGLASLYAPRAAIVNLSAGEPKAASGPEAIEAFFESWFATLPGSMTVENLIDHDGWVALEWTASIGLKGCDMIHVSHGSIAFHRRYFDSQMRAKAERLIKEDMTKGSL